MKILMIELEVAPEEEESALALCNELGLDMHDISDSSFAIYGDRLPELVTRLQESECGAEDGAGFGCTLPQGHKGDHMAQGTLNNVIREWPQT